MNMAPRAGCQMNQQTHSEVVPGDLSPMIMFKDPTNASLWQEYGPASGENGLNFAWRVHSAGAFGRPYVSTITNSFTEEPIMACVV
jgi:hypothetical protein